MASIKGYQILVEHGFSEQAAKDFIEDVNDGKQDLTEAMRN